METATRLDDVEVVRALRAGDEATFTALARARAQRDPEDHLLCSEVRAVVERAIEELAPTQRAVIASATSRCWPGDEVCNAVEISETNQRVLLHRARSKVRRALEDYFTEAQ